MPVLRLAACLCAVAAVALAAAGLPGVSRAAAVPRSLASLNWTKLAVPKLPVAAGGTVYDGANHTMVMFGGVTAPATWVWNGATWIRKHPATSPSIRCCAAMTYYLATHNVVLFGGSDGNRLRDTWTWGAS